MAGIDANVSLTRRERFFRALARQQVDRPPVICTGGSMTATPAEVVKKSGFSLPEAHMDPVAMAGLAVLQPPALPDLNPWVCLFV